MGRKFGRGGDVPIWGELGAHLKNMAWTDAYLHTKWHPNPFNRLATICIYAVVAGYPQVRQTTVRYYRAKRFTNGRQKTG